MGMGRSAGRSRRNRTGEGAAFRASQRQREYTEPPAMKTPDEPEPMFQLTERGEHVLELVAMASVAFAGSLAGVVISGWFGLI